MTTRQDESMVTATKEIKTRACNSHKERDPTLQKITKEMGVLRSAQRNESDT